jgi:hypothetical protein
VKNVPFEILGFDVPTKILIIYIVLGNTFSQYLLIFSWFFSSVIYSFCWISLSLPTLNLFLGNFLDTIVHKIDCFLSVIIVGI